MNCDDFKSMDNLDQLTAARAAHVATCPSCAQWLSDMRALSVALARIQRDEPTAQFVHRVRERLVAEQRRSRPASGWTEALAAGLVVAAACCGLYAYDPEFVGRCWHSFLELLTAWMPSLPTGTLSFALPSPSLGTTQLVTAVAALCVGAIAVHGALDRRPIRKQWR